MSREVAEIASEMLALMHSLGVEIANGGMEGRVRHKPLIGGVFGLSGFSLCSYNSTFSGLDVPIYMVLERSGLVLASMRTKAEAISTARTILKALGSARLQAEIELFQAAALKDRDERSLARQRLREEQGASRNVVVPIKAVPKRRQKVFDASGGKCHYCATTLTLDGKWHVEHRMPVALQGDNAPSNLVASCTSCNFDKRDLTDQEYLAKRARRNKVTA
jgi:5-methylcytosine-specific restriction endonuclease McrA